MGLLSREKRASGEKGTRQKIGLRDYVSVITVVAVIVAIYYRSIDWNLQQRLETVLHALEKLENTHVIKNRPKVAVGYGVCTDVYVDAGKLLKYSDDIGAPEHFNEINTKEQLFKSFAYYFRHGAAAERYMSNRTLFDELVSEARSFSSSYSSIGGNAALMGLRFLQEGCDVVMAAKMTRSLLQMIPEAMTVIGGESERDDIHLILEYKRGETWGPYSSERANRFIIHHDVHNPGISGLEDMEEMLPKFKPDLLVVSGLQMMDSYPFSEGDRLSRIMRVNKQMKSQPKSTKIHFEMASYVEESLLLQLNDLVIPFADSLGMNEQEIINLQHSLRYGNISLVTNSSPRIATVLDEMRSLFKLIRTRSKSVDNSRDLTRIHVHTLAYQAILTTKEWKNTVAAAAKASLTAHRHVCSTSNIDVQKATLIMDDSFTTSRQSGKQILLHVDKPVSCWKESLIVNEEHIDVDFCVAPVLVCTDVRQTAGGGDNISSAGLVLQI